jgi:hypothetical protein
MAVTIRSSDRSVSGNVSAALKKPTHLIISEKDKRNSPDYIKNFPGTIKVLSEKAFSEWLAAEYSEPGSSSVYADGEVLNDSVANTLYGQIDANIKPPSGLAWNQKDIHYITSDNEIFENITITFDTSPTDDGTYEYHVFYESTGPTNQSKVVSDQTASNTNKDISNFKIVTHTASQIKFSWNHMSSTTNYEVVVNGMNIPGQKVGTTGTHVFTMPASGGVSKNNSYCTGSVANGVYSWILNKQTGNFSGTYSVKIKAIYKTGASTGVNQSVTI